MNRERMQEGMRLFLDGLLEETEGFSRSDRAEILTLGPSRVSRAFADDLLSGYEVDLEEIIQPMQVEEVQGPVVLSNLSFSSVCAHHLLPFSGRVHLGYRPQTLLAGLGQIARLVDALSRRLTLQEGLAVGIAEHLMSALDPSALVVRIEAEHTCLAARGARDNTHRYICQECRGTPDEEVMRLVDQASR